MAVFLDPHVVQQDAWLAEPPKRFPVRKEDSLVGRAGLAKARKQARAVQRLQRSHLSTRELNSKWILAECRDTRRWPKHKRRWPERILLLTPVDNLFEACRSSVSS
jgi:hypothetical protein